ncbi:DNA cytosine methyltransferase [Streptomyces coryli]|uniref:DNA cytosine methyltransferase n=1 Tax=Streptomyces coryli TaxID=1128680 RepID=UPI0019D31967|nr:DNA cytosine methyltransferase [Streptomyces coryli]
MREALDRPAPFVAVSNYGTGGDPKARGRRLSSEPTCTVTGKVSRLRLEDETGDVIGRLSTAEAGRLQYFPVDYPWSGRDIAQQIGSTMPPLPAAHVLAAALGRTVPDGGYANTWISAPGHARATPARRFSEIAQP